MELTGGAASVKDKTMVLQCETSRVEGVMYDLYWQVLQAAGFSYAQLLPDADGRRLPAGLSPARVVNGDPVPSRSLNEASPSALSGSPWPGSLVTPSGGQPPEFKDPLSAETAKASNTGDATASNTGDVTLSVGHPGGRSALGELQTLSLPNKGQQRSACFQMEGSDVRAWVIWLND